MKISVEGFLAITFGVMIFLFTLNVVTDVNQTIPRYEDLTLNSGRILTSKLVLGKRPRVKFLVTLDTDRDRKHHLPRHGDYKEILNLIGEYAEIRTHTTTNLGLFDKVEVWDVKVAGKHYYQYEFRKANQPKSKSFAYKLCAAFWGAYLLMFFVIRQFKTRQLISSKIHDH